MHSKSQNFQTLLVLTILVVTYWLVGTCEIVDVAWNCIQSLNWTQDITVIWSLFSFSKPSRIYSLFFAFTSYPSWIFYQSLTCNLHHSISKCIQWRVGVDYGEEMHRLVKNFNPRQGYLRQQLVHQTRRKQNNNIKIPKLPQVGVLWRPIFLS